MVKRIFIMLTVMLHIGIVGTMAQDATTGKATVQNEGISFIEGKSFDEALEMAANKGKMLFMDCYTSWCGPCRMMATKVFTTKEAGEYFNDEFISIKIDMEKGEGPELRNKFKIKAYPTFLFFDKEGKEIGRIVGGEPDVKKFIEEVKAATGSMSLSAMSKKYDGGERDTAFLMSYLKVLDMAYDKEKSDEVANALLKGRDEELLQNEALYRTFLKYNTTPLSPAFQYVLANKSLFYSRYDKDELDRTMAQVWKAYPLGFIKKGNDGSCSFDKEGMEAYKAEMAKWKVENADEIILNTGIYAAQSMKEWDKYATLCSKYINEYGEKDMLIYNWALCIKNNCNDKRVRETAIAWMKKRLKNIEKEKGDRKKTDSGTATAISMVDFSQHYEKMIDELSQ